MNDVAGSINAHCADRLREAADLLEAQRANPFRVSAYRKAATTVLDLPEDVAGIAARDGLPGLEALPNVGRGIAASGQTSRSGRSTSARRERSRSVLSRFVVSFASQMAGWGILGCTRAIFSAVPPGSDFASRCQPNSVVASTTAPGSASSLNAGRHRCVERAINSAPTRATDAQATIKDTP